MHLQTTLTPMIRKPSSGKQGDSRTCIRLPMQISREMEDTPLPICRGKDKVMVITRQPHEIHLSILSAEAR